MTKEGPERPSKKLPTFFPPQELNSSEWKRWPEHKHKREAWEKYAEFYGALDDAKTIEDVIQACESYAVTERSGERVIVAWETFPSELRPSKHLFDKKFHELVEVLEQLARAHQQPLEQNTFRLLQMFTLHIEPVRKALERIYNIDLWTGEFKDSKDSQ